MEWVTRSSRVTTIGGWSGPLPHAHNPALRPIPTLQSLEDDADGKAARGARPANMAQAGEEAGHERFL